MLREHGVGFGRMNAGRHRDLGLSNLQKVEFQGSGISVLQFIPTQAD
jgi:hypothetical protein